MSSFDRSWLALREPCDHASRSGALVEAFAAALPPSAALVDLGSGTGSNLRYLAPRLSETQDWLLVDHDPALLDAAAEVITSWASTAGWSIESAARGLRLSAERRRVDVRFARRDLSSFSGIPAPEVDGLTASALLDLTSARWLGQLAERCRDTAVLIALSFDGRLVWTPEDAEDEAVHRRFLAHQRTDKGFGAALGPDACRCLASELDARGHRVRLAASDWHLGPGDGALLQEMLEGIVAAVSQGANDRLLGPWSDRRRQQLAAGDLRLTVGHQDLLALPG